MIDPRWSGDRIRDKYEQALLHAFDARGKLVLGICRGLQLMNVALGGTLWQDLDTQRPGPVRHRDVATYDRNLRALEFVAGSRLAALHRDASRRGVVNSVHHQGIKDLAAPLVVEARSPDDGLIEAVRRPGGSYMAAVQWHPEFSRPGDGTLDDMPMLVDFLEAAATAKRR